jgi:hypothetical protein
LGRPRQVGAGGCRRVGFGQLQDDLRAQSYSYTLVGGSAGGGQLEKDSTYCQRVLADGGIAAQPTSHFDTAATAMPMCECHRLKIG